MTTQADFTEEEWKTVLEGPTSAGLVVIAAEHGGTFRETFSMAKAYAEARQQHGSSELLDAIVSTRPKSDHTRYHSPDELKQAELQHIRDAIGLLASKATPQELEDYRKFVVGLSTRVAEAHKEHGSDNPIGPAEETAIGEIKEALAASAPASSSDAS
jgi:hypothetical protein